MVACAGTDRGAVYYQCRNQYPSGAGNPAETTGTAGSEEYITQIGDEYWSDIPEKRRFRLGVFGTVHRFPCDSTGICSASYT